MRKMLSSIILLSVVLFTGCVNNTNVSVKTKTHKVTTEHSKLNVIKFKKAKGIFNAQSALFIDARGGKLYKKGTILGAINIPTKKYKKLKKFLPSKKAKLVVFCNGFKCEKAEELAVLLQKDGFKKVLVYKGGYPEWKEKKQLSMGLVKKCKAGKKGPYKPKGKMVTINGAKVYTGGESIEDGMVDQFWLAQRLNSKKGLPKNIQLVDIRKASQFKEGHIKGAINISWDSKAEKIDYTKFPKGKLVIFYCNTGMQSTDARGSLPSDVAKGVLYFDANVNCEGSKCKITANENL